jgi:tetratricopeptide (TPR) repeat protein
MALKDIEPQLDELYAQGVDHARREQWDEALAVWQELQRRAPGYKDVETRLTTAQHMAGILATWQEAQDSLEQGEFAACVDRADELRRLDANYKRDEVRALRQQALKRMHAQAVRLLEREDLEPSLKLLADLRVRSPNYAGLDELEAQVKNGLRERDQLGKLEDLYQQAVVQLGRRDYALALQLWETIQSQGGPDYDDPRDVEARAKDGLCASLYSQTLSTLAQRNPRQALALWRQVIEIDPHYPDSQDCAKQAGEMINQCTSMYRQVQECLTQQAPQQALELWRQVRELDSHFPDSAGVGERAERLMVQGTILYDQSRDALVDGEPVRALELWERVCAVDPHYLDSQDVQGRARDMLDRQEADRRRKRLWLMVGLVGGGILILIVLFASGVFSSCSPQATDTPSLSPSPSLSLEPVVLEPTSTALTQSQSPTNTPLDQAHDTPFGQAHDTPFGQAHDTPFGQAHDTPAPSSTMTMTFTPTQAVTAAPTHSPSSTMTMTPTPTGSLDLATAVQPSSVFEAPSAASRELAVVEVGEQVTVLGRSASGGWFYVRDEQGVEGFAHAPRFGWEGDFEALPVLESDFTPLPPVVNTPTPTSPPGGYPPLSIDFWQLPGTERCDAQAWRQSVWIQGQGGDGTYTYYRDGELLAGPLSNEGYSFEIGSAAGALIITGKVVSGDGQQAQREIYVPEPTCD